MGLIMEIVGQDGNFQVPACIHFMGSTNIEVQSAGWFLFSQDPLLLLFHLKLDSPFPRSWEIIFSSEATILLHFLHRYISSGLATISGSEILVSSAIWFFCSSSVILLFQTVLCLIHCELKQIRVENNADSYLELIKWLSNSD